MISIAIVTLNNAEYLDLALRAIELNTVGPFEVLIHANSGQQSELEVIKKWEKIGVVTAHTVSKQNEFCAKPLNRLFNEYSQGNYFIFLDDDTYVAPGWDEALRKAISKQHRYWWLSPTLYYPKYAHQKTRYNTQSFGLTPREFNENAFNKYYLKLRNIVEDNPGWISGAGLISRELWMEIGGYDETFLIGEDVDIKAKIWNAANTAGESYDFRSIADSLVYHFGHSGSSKREMVIDPFAAFQKKWGMSITEFYKTSMPAIDYL